MFFKSNNSVGDTFMTKPNRIHNNCKRALVATAVAASIAAASIAQAQTAGPPTGSVPGTPAGTEDTSLTWHGITLSGVVDVGLQYQPHAAPVSDYYGAGGYNLVQADSLRAVGGITPNNLSQSFIQLAGVEPIYQDVSAIFKLQTLFQPNSGNLTDGIKSLTLNNGKAAKNQINAQDSDAAGQLFGGAAYGGLSSKTFGTLTYGWQPTLLSDGVIKYDPNAGSYAFSLIGQSGTARGGGNTEDKRFKNSLKYLYSANGFHAGVMYEFSDDGSGTANSAYQMQLGAEFGGLSVDAFYSKVYDAISAASLSAAQVTDLAPLGYSSNTAVAGTISDNVAYGFMGSFAAGPAKLFGGFERVQFANPSTALTAGTPILGGYIMAFVTNNKYTTDKDQDIYWLGAKVTVMTRLELTAAYYGYHADSYQNLAVAPCTTAAHGNCSGTESVGSVDAIYHYSKRFDGYVGAMYSEVANGLASGFVNKSTINPTIGVRFKF
jgi:predicted porin